MDEILKLGKSVVEIPLRGDKRPKFYIHPIDMVRVYVDDQPTRDAALALSPHPDTIGPFVSAEEAEQWITMRREVGYASGLEIVPKP